MTPIIIEEGNIKAFEKPVTAEMDKGFTHFEKDLSTVRTGKAHVGMIEDVKVECYGGTIMNLRDVASLAAPDVNMLTIQPWDKGIMHDIERAITTSHLGLSPVVDGDMIRLELPRMTTSRRDELAKLVGKKVEDSKINIRNVRKDFVNMIKDAQKSKKISEDFEKRLNKTLQEITDKYVEKIDALGEKKKNELRAL
ncbi:MAG TPA: ribosome recycling factor [Candidatus Saccharimonadales bacterium]|nr:ribosome recycling factor [Candidatus Saccharimonadales bacterium]